MRQKLHVAPFPAVELQGLAPQGTPPQTTPCESVMTEIDLTNEDGDMDITITFKLSEQLSDEIRATANQIGSDVSKTIRAAIQLGLPTLRDMPAMVDIVSPRLRAGK